MTPDVLRQRYNLSASDVGNLPNGTNSQCVAQFLNQYYEPADLVEFFNLFGANFAHKNTADLVIGPDLAFGGTEASLDIEVQVFLMSTTSPARQSHSGGGFTVHNVHGRKHFHVVLVNARVCLFVCLKQSKSIFFSFAE